VRHDQVNTTFPNQFLKARRRRLPSQAAVVDAALRLVGIGFVFERLDHVAISITNANDDWMPPADRLCIANCVDDRV
jgi:hypothetical protein